MSGAAEKSDEVDEATPLRTPMSPLTAAAGDVVEIPLDMVPGSGHAPDDDDDGGWGGKVSVPPPPPPSPPRASCCCRDEHHRTLAICSIVCGFTCFGYKALINSVKAETATDVEAADKFSRKARKLGIISIVLWVLFVVSVPVLMCLISYLLTFLD